MAGPLDGLRVIDCSRGTAGPRATGLLADYGADVVWVERPGGDPLREALAIEYSVFNRGKRSVELDLKVPTGIAALLDLIAGADLFVQSWRPGAAARLGLDYAAVHARSPGVVYCSISGFGVDGPHRDVPGYESIVHAIVGTTGEQVGHRTPPIYEGLPFAAIGASYLALIGALAALYRRHDDGIGREVETSLLDGALAYLSMLWGDTDVGAPTHIPGTVRLIAGSYLCADDEYIGVHTGAVGAFGRLMKILGLDDRIPPSADGMDIGVPLSPEQRELLHTESHRIFASVPRAVWLERLLAADICAVPHLHPGQVFDEAQPIHNGMVVKVDDPVLGPLEQVGPPIRFTRTPGGVRGPAPLPGQHTAEVMSERSTVVERVGSVVPADQPLLAGLKVLDLGAYYAGPYSSRLLADLGADVIKLETTAGDQLRGMSRPFRSAQAGKRSVAANLKDPDLADAVLRLVAWADVIHHNMRPGAAERLGIGYEQVATINPGAIYLYAPGWGSSGPDMNRQSFAPMLSGYVGVGFEVAGQYNPPLFPAGNEDNGNGLVGAVAVLIGLLHRQRTGEGQLIENPQVNAAMNHLAHVVRRSDGTVLGAERLDPLQYGISALDRLYETADGWISLVAGRDEHIAALGAVFGIDVLSDPRFATPAARSANDYELVSLLADRFSSRATAEWLSALQGADVPAVEPIQHNNVVAFLADPENRRTGRVAEVPHAKDGHVRELATLVRVSDAAAVPHRLAPELGQHSDEILSWLGYDADRIATLRARGAVR